MIDVGLPGPGNMIVAAYGALVFFLTLWKPKYGLYFAIPIIGIGFENSSVIKGGIITILFAGTVMHNLWRGKMILISRESLGIMLVIACFVIWVLARGMIFDEGMNFWFSWILKRIIAPGGLAFLAIWIIETPRDLMRYLWAVILFCVMTSVIGLCQYFFQADFFWKLREVLGVPQPIAYQIAARSRIVGISSYVVPFSYQLLSVVPILFAWCFSKRRRVLAIMLSVLVFLALVLSFMKSAVIGAVIGSLFVLWFAYKRKYISQERLFVIGMACLIAFAAAGSTALIRQNIFHLRDSSLERVAIYTAATRIAIRYPIGVGYTYSDKVEDVYGEISALPGAHAALVHFPHSIVLDTHVILGFPALVLVMLFYLALMRLLIRKANHSDDRDISLLYIGLIGSFVAYVCNALFHNNSPFFGDAFNWLFIGAALVCLKTQLPYQSRL